jgi:hypothetical protein
MNRRRFLTLPLALWLVPLGRVLAAGTPRKGDFAADVAILYGAFTLHLAGTVDEVIDRTAGRYDVTINGEGTRIANRIQSQGVLRNGRWAPVRTTSWFQVVGRESQTTLLYDYGAGTADYRFRGETFLLRRVRVAQDVLPLGGEHVDDAISAILNYAEGRWPADADGRFRTRLIRRRRPANEGPDDVDTTYRAEFLPFVLRIDADRETGKPTALFDLRGFSSWAREDRPARIVFGADRRPELIASSLILGTSITIHLRTIT